MSDREVREALICQGLLARVAGKPNQDGKRHKWSKVNRPKSAMEDTARVAAGIPRPEGGEEKADNRLLKVSPASAVGGGGGGQEAHPY